MRKYFVIFLLFSSYCFSQSTIPSDIVKRIDSLNALVNKESNDTMKLKLLRKINNQYLDNGFYEEALNSAKKNLELIGKLNQGAKNSERYISIKRSEVKCLNIIALSLQSQGKNEEALIWFEKMLALARSIDFIFAVGNVQQNLGNVYMDLSKKDKALEYYNKALDTYSKMKDSTNIAVSYVLLGDAYQLMGDLGRSEQNYLKALAIAKIINNESTLTKIYGNYGTALQVKGDYSEALKYLLMSLQLAEKNEFTSGIGMASVNIANLYYKQSDYKKALQYYLKGLKCHESKRDKENIASTLANIGNIYDFLNDYDRSLQYHKKALELYEELQNKDGIALVNTNLGTLFEHKKDDNKALEHYFKALKLHQESGYAMGTAVTLGKIGLIYTHSGSNLPSSISAQERLLIAEKKIEESLALKDSITALDVLRELHSNAAIFYSFKAENTNDNQIKAESLGKAYLHTQKENELRDSLFNAQSVKLIAEMNSKYETEKKERENKILAQENELQKYELTKKNYFIGGMVFVVILIISLTFLFIRQNKLKAAQKTIELEQKLLRTQLNPHFIFNSLNAIQNFIYKNNAQNAADYLSKFASLMRMILNNSRAEFISLEKEIAGLNLYLELQALRFNQKFEYEIITDHNIDPSSLAIPPMLAQPFIENAIEHGLLHKEAKGKLTIRFLLRSDHILFEVEDNGVGREKAAELRKKTDPEHKSLAVTITKERLTILSKGARKKFELDIIDLKGEMGNALGTKVVFLIPFAEI